MDVQAEPLPVLLPDQLIFLPWRSDDRRLVMSNGTMSLLKEKSMKDGGIQESKRFCYPSIEGYLAHKWVEFPIWLLLII